MTRDGGLEALSDAPEGSGTGAEDSRSFLGKLNGVVDRARKLAERGVGFIARMRTPLGEVTPYVPGQTQVARLLAAPAIVGFVSAVAVTWGASLPSSPFTWKTCSGIVPGSVTVCHPWFFGIPPPQVVSGAVLPANKDLFIGLVAVYGGMVLMMQAWIALVRIARRHRGLPVRAFAVVFAAWTAPLLVVAPLFSRDAYSYAAQGEMMSRGISPYLFGPAVLGVNAFSGLVDKLWANVTSPYGPAFLWIAGVNATVVRHNELLAVIGFRLLALAGVVMIAVFVPRIARSYGRDPSIAFVLAALNPLVLLHLVAGAHNDALMVGFLVAGLALAREGRPVLGVLLCAVGAMIKVPAFAGVIYIGWAWMGEGVPWRSRLRPTIVATFLALLLMTGVSQMVGLGWGWVSALNNPGTVRSWIDPPTAVGLWAARLVTAAGLGNHEALLLAGARDLGLLVAGAIGVRLLWRANGAATMRAMGLTFLAVVWLGPSVQPWYLAWTVVILATVAEHRLRVLVIVLSCVACFFGLPGARELVVQFGEANPILIASASIALVLLLAIPVVLRVRRALRTPDTGRALVVPPG